jgi:hypothetical protein
MFLTVAITVLFCYEEAKSYPEFIKCMHCKMTDLVVVVDSTTSDEVH